MSYIKRPKLPPYSFIHRVCLEDERLSFKAKGLWAYCVTRPPGWKLRTTHLKTVGTDGRDAVRAAFVELEEAGYVIRQRVRNRNGAFLRMDYVMLDYPEQGMDIPTSIDEDESGDETPELDEIATDGKPVSGKTAELATNGFPGPGSPGPGSPGPGKAGRIVSNEVSNELELVTNEHTDTATPNAPAGTATPRIVRVVEEDEEDMGPSGDTAPDRDTQLAPADVVASLLVGFGVAGNNVAYMRHALIEATGRSEADMPGYPQVGAAFKVFTSVYGDKAAEKLLRSMSALAISQPDVSAGDLLREAIGKAQEERRSRRKKATPDFVAPSEAEVGKFFAQNGSTYREGEEWCRFMASRAWQDVRNWEPLALNRIARIKDNQPDRSKETLYRHEEATRLWEAKRASNTISFSQFFQTVDAKGNPVDPKARRASGDNSPVYFRLVATQHMMKA